MRSTICQNDISLTTVIVYSVDYQICYLYFKTPQVGFEPTTNRLTVDRSATELLRISSLDICHNNESQNNWQAF